MEQLTKIFSHMGTIAIYIKDWLINFTKETIDYLIANPIMLIPMVIMFFVMTINTIRRLIKGV